MDTLSKEELKKLITKPGGQCISIFMPTHRARGDIQQDQIRLKNVLGETEERLSTSGLRSPEVRELLEPVQNLILDTPFWQTQSNGLAIFRSPEVFACYHLPFNFEELLVISDRFHIKPILPLLNGEEGFYILALSQNKVSLFQGTRYSVNEVELANVPDTLAETLKYDEPEKQLQFHTGTPRGIGRRAAMFHGHGVGTDDNKDRILRYFRLVDACLHELLKNERVPLVLAGVDYLLPIYKEVNNYPYLAADGIEGNPEGMSVEELHKEACAIVQPCFQKKQQKTADRYRQLAGTGLTSNDIKEAVPAAHQGRIESLFVTIDLQQWGTYNPNTNTVHPHRKAEPGDDDLLDLAAVQTLLNGGTVYAVDTKKMPDRAPLAAVFRY
ncbi:MAG: hypothetical protein WC834_00895 [Eubacteriales bacterium]